MRRNDLSNLPEVSLPKGYSLRSYRAGDEAAWVRIIGESFERDHPADYFDQRMRRDPEFRAERILFVCRDEEPVATASAWYDPRAGAQTGVLHMVGVRPGEAGHGLGREVSVAALRQMRHEGRRRAELKTDDFRVPAIKTYLKLGFEPLLVAENQRGRWRDVLGAIGRGDLIEQFTGILEGPIRPEPAAG
jgi:mycothiol synthase